MTLEIGIAADDTSLYSSMATPSVSIDNDGYYWYLHPLFEDLQRQTGQYINLYGNAEFTGTNIKAFIEMLQRAKGLISLQANNWDVHIGTQTEPEKRKLFSAVDKRKFFDLIRQLEKIAEAAETTDCRIVCIGD